MIKKYLGILFFFVVSTITIAQTKPDTVRAGLMIKITFIPLVGESGVAGKLVMTNDSLFFTAIPCSEKEKKRSNIIPCNAHLIKPIRLSFKQIKKIQKRGYLFLIPNRLFVQTIDNESYIFGTYRRKLIKRRFEKAKSY
ncbi:MAG: hypothetical protein ACK4GN_13380 [Runella sp.]